LFGGRFQEFFRSNTIFMKGFLSGDCQNDTPPTKATKKQTKGVHPKRRGWLAYGPLMKKREAKPTGLIVRCGSVRQRGYRGKKKNCPT